MIRKPVLSVVLVLVAAVLTLAAAAGCSSTPPPVTAHGTVEVALNLLDGTNPQDAYPDITDGGQVTVVNPSGTVVGTGTLASDAKDSSEETEVFTFAATVPGGLPRYGIQVGRDRGTVWFSRQQMQKGPGLCVGDACSG